MTDETTTISSWDRVLLARNAQRPHTLRYISQLCTDFVELHGDRASAEDAAMVGGIGRFRGRTVMIVGHQKGENTKENIARNFGMPRPAGYRKALRLMRQAEKFGIPLISFVDTPGADPGLASEEGGQAFAIADNVFEMAALAIPTIAVIIGEGGSGGALAICVSDRVLMLENAIYSVASPEACASILFKDATRAPDAAAAMRVNAHDLLAFGLVDEMISEPIPAHEDPTATITAVGDAIECHLRDLEDISRRGTGGERALLDARYAKYRAMGRWHEETSAQLVADGASQPA